MRKRDPALEEEARIAARIADGVRQDDADAKRELIERYSQGLLYLLRRRIGDEERARDLLHDTFCIALEKLAAVELEHPERLAGYLRGIAVRVAMGGSRQRKREPIPVDDDIVASVEDMQPRQFENVSRNETAAAVHRLLDEMTVPRDRELLQRYYVYEQDKKEICRALGLDSLHFNRVLFRAKKRFRQLLESSPSGVDLVPD